MAYWKQQKGQSTLEIIIALALLVMTATASFVLLGQTLSENELVSRRGQAERLAREGVEATRQMRDRAWELLTDGTYGLTQSGNDWIFSGTSDETDDLFTRTVTVTTIDNNTREVTVNISWQATLLRSTQVATTTQFTNWRLITPPPVGSNCRGGGTVSGDWTNPIVVGSADLGSGNEGTDIVVDLPYIYVSGVASSSAKPDLFVFDATDLAFPQLIRTVETGANGINSLALSGDYLYAASSNDSREFMVFDVSIPALTSLATSSNLSGTSNALSVIAKDNLVALGREGNTGNELFFYDVTTPTSPTLLSSADAVDDVNDFATSETHLFIVTDASNDDLIVYDITDPLTPTYAATYNIADGDDDISVAYHDPGTVFVGNEEDSMLLIDVSNLTAIAQTGSLDAGGEVQDVVCVVDNLAFLATTNSTNEFLIFNITDLNNIVEYGSLNFPQVATGADFANNHAFISIRSNDALRIITSSP